MKQAIGESLSALMDQEADELDLQRVVNGLKDDPDLSQRWRRYHLMSRAMHHDLDDFAEVDLTAGLREALPAESPDLRLRVSPQRLTGLLKPVASVAVAASVTAVILGGAQVYQLVADGAQAPMTAIPGDVSAAVTVSRRVGFSSPMLQASAVAGLPVVDGSASLEKPLRGPKLENRVLDYNQADALARQKLNLHLHSHLENASLNTSSGMMPFARAVSYQGER